MKAFAMPDAAYGQVRDNGSHDGRDVRDLGGAATVMG